MLRVVFAFEVFRVESFAFPIELLAFAVEMLTFRSEVFAHASSDHPLEKLRSFACEVVKERSDQHVLPTCRCVRGKYLRSQFAILSSAGRDTM